MFLGEFFQVVKSGHSAIIMHNFKKYPRGPQAGQGRQIDNRAATR